MPRTLADIVRRVSRGYGIPTSEAERLLGRPIFSILIDDLRDEEATDVFSQRPSYGSILSPATAAVNSRIQLFNPAGSGVIAVLNRVLIASDVLSAFQGSELDTPFGNQVVTKAFRDRRITGNPACDIDHSEIGAAVGGAIKINGRLAADIPVVVELDIILQAGQGFHFGLNTQNQLITGTFFWREEAA